MDTSSTVAGWLSFLATVIGLGSLITQTNTIGDRLDPYHTSRTREYLGRWLSRQPRGQWYHIGKSPPVGPVLCTRLVDGFCGRNVVGVSGRPLGQVGKASWTAFLEIFHEVVPAMAGIRKSTTAPPYAADGMNFDKMSGSFALDVDPPRRLPASEPWSNLRTQPLRRYDSSSGIPITRTSLITILAMCNSREMFDFSDASGHRVGYSAYCGHWYISWPLGGPAVVSFAPHEIPSPTPSEVFPRMLQVRVDKCVQILCGIITSPDTIEFKGAFPGRRASGKWVLEYRCKGFSGAHGSRYLYYLQGGKVYEVDRLFARPVEADSMPPPSNCVGLRLPSKDKGDPVSLLVPHEERKILEKALDYLPWSSLSWSIHRSLRDLSVAFAKPTMDRYRKALAARLRRAVFEQADQLEGKGWESNFVKNHMADIAVSSVLAGGGYSGDSVKVVTDVTLLLQPSNISYEELDETTFWREGRHEVNQDVRESLSIDACIALTKCFVLEWSVEFDYQMYHDLPPELLFR